MADKFNKLKTSKTKKIAVALSGGVDSSVAAFLLKKQGFDIIGLTAYLGSFSKKSVKKAKTVCQKLGISHYTVDLSNEFKKKIIEQFCEKYFLGLTPNPCIWCNKFIKFGLLLKKAQSLGFSKLATGHYVRLLQTKIKTKDKKNKVIYHLLKSRDKIHDQSYFLYRLSQQQLKKSIFPLGNLSKEKVLKIASENNLLSTNYFGSQEICFIPGNDYRKFFKKKYKGKFKQGLILDKKGNILGKHNGIAFYTIGQRKGLKIYNKRPFYVIRIDKNNNTIIVGRKNDLYKKELIAKNINWINKYSLKLPINVEAKIRYRHLASRAKVLLFNKNKIKVIFEKSQKSITPGQSIVFYKNDEILGGGVIC